MNSFRLSITLHRSCQRRQRRIGRAFAVMVARLFLEELAAVASTPLADGSRLRAMPIGAPDLFATDPRYHLVFSTRSAK